MEPAGRDRGWRQRACRSPGDDVPDARRVVARTPVDEAREGLGGRLELAHRCDARARALGLPLVSAVADTLPFGFRWLPARRLDGEHSAYLRRVPRPRGHGRVDRAVLARRRGVWLRRG